jgi:hypothetical protein
MSKYLNDAEGDQTGNFIVDIVGKSDLDSDPKPNLMMTSSVK